MSNETYNAENTGGGEPHRLTAGIHKYHDLDAGDEDSDTESATPRPVKEQSDRQSTKKWLGTLALHPDAAIFSLCVTAITTLVQTIRRDFVGEKILIASPSLMFLDILRQALQRMLWDSRLNDINSVELNGTMDVMERADALRQFNGKSMIPNVLLMSAESAGTGLNIAGASHVILTEPFWSPGKEGQAARLPGHWARIPHVPSTGGDG
ncbi:hypothetical protein VTK56DRAFT_3783 [Thermocarpiscus australiensis]